MTVPEGAIRATSSASVVLATGWPSAGTRASDADTASSTWSKPVNVVARNVRADCLRVGVANPLRELPARNCRGCIRNPLFCSTGTPTHPPSQFQARDNSICQKPASQHATFRLSSAHHRRPTGRCLISGSSLPVSRACTRNPRRLPHAPARRRASPRRHTQRSDHRLRGASVQGRPGWTLPKAHAGNHNRQARARGQNPARSSRPLMRYAGSPDISPSRLFLR